MLKEAGRSKQNKKKVYKDIKCQNCRGKIDVDSCLKNDDFDFIPQTNEYQIFCPKCGESNLVKK